MHARHGSDRVRPILLTGPRECMFCFLPPTDEINIRIEDSLISGNVLEFFHSGSPMLAQKRTTSFWHDPFTAVTQF